MPISASALVNDGSSDVPIATSPPGIARFESLVPYFILTTFVVKGSNLVDPFSTILIPGFISISSPTLISPLINPPPITPPTSFSGGVPGD